MGFAEHPEPGLALFISSSRLCLRAGLNLKLSPSAARSRPAFRLAHRRIVNRVERVCSSGIIDLVQISAVWAYVAGLVSSTKRRHIRRRYDKLIIYLSMLQNSIVYQVQYILFH